MLCNPQDISCLEVVEDMVALGTVSADMDMELDKELGKAVEGVAEVAGAHMDKYMDTVVGMGMDKGGRRH